MRVDISNALEDRVEDGLGRDEVTGTREKVNVLEEVKCLPHRTDVSAVAEAGERLREEFDAFVNIGIGGSALGGATLVDALAPDAPVDFVDNVDPDHLRRLLEGYDLDRTVFSVVSKSGKTAETVANYSVVRSALEDEGFEPSEHTVVTTGDDSPLAEVDAVERFDFPDVPGRYSALSVVGLLPAAFGGVDVERVAEGGERASAADGDDPERWRALGTTAYALGERGFDTSVMMPYSERLERFAEWYAQIWAESLGKDGYGQTPVRALGATDQHSLLQLLVDGPRDKFVTLVDPGDPDPRDDPVVDTPKLIESDYLDGATVGELRDAEMDATQASLVEEDVPSVRVELDGVQPDEVGELLQTYKLATVVAGRLADVNPFNQPGVEWGKRAARGTLGDESCSDERSVAESYKETLLRL